MRGAVGSQLHFFSFFLLLGIIALGVVGALYIQFGGDLDVRALASERIASRMEACVWHGIQTFTGCGLVVTSLERDAWIGRLCTGDCFRTGEILDGFGGNVEACRLSGDGKNKNYPRCSEHVFVVNGISYHLVVGTNYRGGHHA